jgi:DNA-binding transcriptional ArsR family regulator
MISRTVTIFVALILCVQIGFAQTGANKKDEAGGAKSFGPGAKGEAAPKKEKDLKDMTLDELLAKALKDNPDLHLAESKVREAEAELSRTRLRVLQNVSKVVHEIGAARELLAAGTQLFELTKRMVSGVSNRELMESHLTVVRLKADVAKLEAELVQLVGKHPGGVKISTRDVSVGSDQGVPGSIVVDGSSAAERQVPAELAEKVREALDTPIKVSFEEATPGDIIEYLRRHVEHVNLHVTAKVPNKPISLKLGTEISVGAFLQWLEDEFGWRCVLRDYGIVIAERDRIPPGATPVLEFWKKSKSSESKSK